MHWPAKHFLRTIYHQIRPPLAYTEGKCHFTAEMVGQEFACEILPKSFDNIKHTEHSSIRISLFYYGTTYLPTTYDHRSSINTVQQNLPPFLVGKSASLSVATWWIYDLNTWYSIWVKLVQICAYNTWTKTALSHESTCRLLLSTPTIAT